eukprot:51029-Rhodomonas_salina.1
MAGGDVTGRMSKVRRGGRDVSRDVVPTADNRWQNSCCVDIYSNVPLGSSQGNRHRSPLKGASYRGTPCLL